MKQEFSAGGVVFRKGSGQNRDDIFILLAQHSQHHGWVFPKGFIGDKIAGESKEATALRETEEETGIRGEILESLTPVAYWYQMDGEKHHKTVYYFLMKEVGGDTSKHDWEMENVEWLPIDKVQERLTFPSDKIVWKEAQEKLQKLSS